MADDVLDAHRAKAGARIRRAAYRQIAAGLAASRSRLDQRELNHFASRCRLQLQHYQMSWSLKTADRAFVELDKYFEDDILCKIVVATQWVGRRWHGTISNGAGVAPSGVLCRNSVKERGIMNSLEVNIYCIDPP
ncbi:uncharacterized protein MYCGRDRAFT_97295 [Zymoseptoria tritici IPO323]|uniref:Uncharacterized protein n=1 Tax=Zymoseptoria tritici (strain CBS 115943 / IPO323) TaxID=336722 RepID=F9XPR8_ZYMTI|nr:uncharacterized protein MYCGRDRAFT_97295 [Zymoseptoria tritici IPO323]EGP82509.1 hypothetical protein MYCGRDRAFT_97295 [Zymoseptoria tritici IPO323]